jgi:hypothetical protein
MCVLCHNPSLVGESDDPSQPRQGDSFNLMVHRIHTGYKNFANIRYPAMSPQGGPVGTRNCAMCHVNESHTMPAGVRDVLDPQRFIHPVKAITSSCIGYALIAKGTDPPSAVPERLVRAQMIVEMEVKIQFRPQVRTVAKVARVD